MVRRISALASLAILAGLWFLPGSASAAPQKRACPDLTAAGGAIVVPSAVGNYGTMQYGQTVTRGDREVVLTFDDGPDPQSTPSILDTLDRYCVKATFFFTGLRAQRHPELVREAALRGHTIASHTYSHPNNLRHLNWTRATRQITRGINEIQAALDGAPETQGLTVAPFFRFPGLNHSGPLRGWLAAQNISTFSCDVGTDDWRHISSRTVVYRALRNIRAKGGGIVIFHDTKPRTAAALPEVLDRLLAEGYRVAHMVPETVHPAEVPGSAVALAVPAATTATQDGLRLEQAPDYSISSAP